MVNLALWASQSKRCLVGRIFPEEALFDSPDKVLMLATHKPTSLSHQPVNQAPIPVWFLVIQLSPWLSLKSFLCSVFGNTQHVHTSPPRVDTDHWFNINNINILFLQSSWFSQILILCILCVVYTIHPVWVYNKVCTVCMECVCMVVPRGVFPSTLHWASAVCVIYIFTALL